MSDTAEVQSAKKPRPFLFPSRIILFAILGVLIIGEVIDLRARSAASAAFEAIQGALGPENQGKITRTKVREIVGREPDTDADKDANDRFETYSWRGGLRTQKVYVSYHDGNDPLVEEVRRNEKPPGFEEEPRKVTTPVESEEETPRGETPAGEEESPRNETPPVDDQEPRDNAAPSDAEKPTPPSQP